MPTIIISVSCGIRNAVVPSTELVAFNPPFGNDILDVTDLPFTSWTDGSWYLLCESATCVQAFTRGSGCESAPFRVDILDKSIDPDH